MTDKEQKRIFIGGLVTAVTEKELVEKFSRFGKVGQLEIKTRNSDLDTKTFAYLNLTAGENDFKKCFTAYNNTKWKGGQLKLQFAKESFLSKLKEEREEAVKKEEEVPAPAEVKTSPALEVYNGKAVPGTLLDEEGKWVMGKYSRVLPVLRVKKPSSKQVVILDPSKTLHALKKLKSDDIAESSAKSADLTWQMDVNDNDITKRRQGEFPAWDPPKKESLFSRLQSLAAEEHISDSDMEVVPVGKTAVKAKPLISTAYDSSDSADSVDTDEIVTKASGKKSPRTQPAKPTSKATPKKDTKSNHGNGLAFASSEAAEKAGTKILQKKKQKVQSSNPTPKNTPEKDCNSTLDYDSDSAGSADTDEIILKVSHKKSVVTKPSNTSNEAGQSKTVSKKTPNEKGYSSGDSDSSENQGQTLKCKTLGKKKGKGGTLKPPVKNKGLTSPTVSSAKKQAKMHKSQLDSDDSEETQSKRKLIKFAKPKPTSDSSGSDQDVSEEETPKPRDAKKSAKATKSLASDARKPAVFNSSVSEPDSDSSDTVKRPQFQFVKTATTQSKCLRKSAKLTQSKTPPFKGLSMLSSGDEMEVAKHAKSTTSVEKGAADSIGKSAVAKKQASKTLKKDLKGNSPSSKDVPLDMKPGSGRKSVDGVAFIQKSHRARQKNLEEVKKQENLITKSIREGTGSKHVKFSDSDEEGSLKKQPVEAETKAAPALFDDSASEEEGDKKADHDFSIRPQFEGKKGQKLMELQTKIKDSRFRMDDRFAESDSDKEEEEEEAEKDPDEIELAEEKARNLKILEQVLGFKPRQRNKANIYQGVKRYLDPVQSKHLEITPETAIASKQKKRKLDSEAQPEIKSKTTTDNTKFDSSDDNSEAEDEEEKSSGDGGDEDKEDEDEKDTDESSEEEEDKAVEEEEESSEDDEEEEKENSKKKGIKAKEADDEEEPAGASNKSNLGDLFAGGSSFTFFGAPVSESSDEEEAEMKSTESSHIITPPAKATVQAEDKEEDMEEEEMEEEEEEEVQSKGVRPAVRDNNKNHKDAEQPSFMISKDDPRLRAAVRFFKRPAEEEFEELVAEWPDQRHNIMQIVRDRHKRALRKERQTQRQEQWKRKHSWKKSRK
ncbi:nucleolar protein 8-like isoform X2 [Littorina saxatilis]|uniref:RRM domain-containing protein n=1 Tax=Littorina saxatilis TaxID=31220 RepID=A0AAN9BBN2_9CAEN